jgi:O-glycosyl hydrolase
MPTIMMIKRVLFLICLLYPCYIPIYAQAQKDLPAQGRVDFTKVIRPWDGFGFNYVETAQTFDYQKWPQDYGGFSKLEEKDKQEIIELVFGNDGLKVSLVKMFLDPLHQRMPGGNYDHKTTTENMRYFVKNGLRTTEQRGDELSVITTLYSPPAYITKQKILRGRDLDPVHLDDLCDYYADWASFLKEEGLPIKYISLHNEGEDWYRWPKDGGHGHIVEDGHDYNFFWPIGQTTQVINRLRENLDRRGLQDIGITNGEYTNWYRFNAWGYGNELANDKQAMDNLALITSHGFYVGDMAAGHWYGPHSSSGNDKLREEKPELHSWTTSTAWNAFTRTEPKVFYTDWDFAKQLQSNIYEAKLNGIIPWAGIQNESEWNKPDPNPGCAIRVFDDGTWQINKAYYYYKQISRAGQPGTNVVDAYIMSSELSLIAFGKEKQGTGSSLVVINSSNEPRHMSLEMVGLNSNKFEAYRTSGREIIIIKDTKSPTPPEGENYVAVEDFKVDGEKLIYTAPPGSVTTFFETGY